MAPLHKHKELVAVEAEKAEREQKSNDNEQDDDNEEDPQRLFWLIRILYVCYYASTGSIIPFLPVYYRSLGHGGQVIGFLATLRSVLNPLVSPWWGMLADSRAANDTDSGTMGILRLSVVGSVVGYLSIGFASDPVSLALAVFVTAVFYAPVKPLLR